MVNTAGVVVVGSGQAGVQLVDSLRSAGYADRITIFGDEKHLPYQRPPLSKDFMADGAGDVLPLRAERFFTDHGVGFHRGTRVTAIDRVAKTVTTEDGAVTSYDKLVLATGARNRSLDLEGADLAGVHYLRTLDDAQALQAALGTARRAVVIGAGFIGLEFAAAARKRGLDVTVIEYADRPMGRVLSLEMSDYFTRAHSDVGIRLRFGEGVTAFRGEGGRVRAVVGSSGTEYPADLVLVGIGVLPNTELAEEAGLAVANGIVVDAALRTADPDIFALGDCANYPSRHTSMPTRLESVQNAADQARYLAHTLMDEGGRNGYESLPWFWSQQGDRKLQIAGLTAPGDIRVARGDPHGAYSVYSFRDGELVAVESVNQPGEHLAARKALAIGLAIEPDQVADPEFRLKDYAAAS